MLQLQQLDKYFGSVHALKAVDFEVRPGEIVGLVGENGAGKSTLMKIIYGAHQHDGGQLLIDGQPTHLAGPRAALERGIGMVFQEQSLILNLSVAENLYLGFEAPFVRGGKIDWPAMRAAARAQLQKVNLDIDPLRSAGTLSFAERQLVELAKVLCLEERVEGQLVVLLDEPTSVLASDEVALLFSLVRSLRSRASFIFVSHRMDEVLELSDRIYVMKDGEVVDCVSSAEADKEAIQRQMVGRDVDREYYRQARRLPVEPGEPLLELQQLSRAGAYRDIDLTLHRGEVLALVGAEGAGREALLRTVFGFQAPSQGQMRIKGRLVTQQAPAQRVRQGIGYLPRERKVEGIVGLMSVAENISLPRLQSVSRFGALQVGRERTLARDWVQRLRIKTPTVDTPCEALSGGNQQKVVLAKWRNTGADILMLDHPTRGLDIGAKEDVYDMIRDLCDDRCGVLLVADTFEEAIGLAHTIVVLRDGEISARFDCLDCAPNPYDLLRAMV